MADLGRGEAPRAGLRRIGRREFGRRSLGATAALGLGARQTPEPRRPSRVALARTTERKAGLGQALGALGGIDFGGREVVLKASFNSPHDFPATSSPEMIELVVGELRARRAGRIRLVERSGMGTTRRVWEALGIVRLARRLDVALVALDELPPEEWRHARLEGSQWSRGVEFPALIGPDTPVVQLCGAKTHRFGAQLSASLKNSIGLIARYSSDGKRHDYMAELHGSPDQRAMIAEVNTLYEPRLVVMDATQVFVDGGPEAGDIALPDVVAAGRDRVALDAVALALLQLNGASLLDRESAFAQEQLRRAGELGLGARRAAEIELVPVGPEASRLAGQVAAVLERGIESK
jgi:uncharacterized protein (DUF362 family)